MEEEELQGVKVLVIDDSKTIRRSAENLLSKEGCDVVITATDGFDALAKIADSKTRDHLRGHHDAATRWLSDLRADQKQQRVQGDAGRHVVQQGRAVRQGQGSASSARTEYITKPFSKEELLGTIRTLVAMRVEVATSDGYEFS